MDRRSLISGLAMTAPMTAAPALAEASPDSYEAAVQQIWRPLAPAGGLRELVRAGTLAANSHNTQPWRFALAPDRITIRPDFSRRCPVVDPDDHHLFASLGCAVENMVQAAPICGFQAHPTLDPAASQGAGLALERRQPAGNPLAEALMRRQSTRSDYDGQTLSSAELDQLARAGSLAKVECRLVTEPARMAAILDYVVQGNSAQMRDPAFMAELISWLRFNDRMALARLDGLSTRSSGRPALPAWLARRLLPWVMTEASENDSYARQIRSSAGIAVFVAPSNDPAGWIAAGRACQRFALQAAALDIRLAFINQPVEVPRLRPQVAAYLGLGERRPDLVVRFGRGPSLPLSLRRPIEAVLDPA